MRKMNGLKWIFLGLVLTAFFCLIMGGVTLRQQIARLKQKPQPPHVVVDPPIIKTDHKEPPTVSPPGPAVPKQPVVQPPAAPPIQLFGKWSGGGPSGADLVTVTLEIRPKQDDVSVIMGYAVITRLNLTSLAALGRSSGSAQKFIAERMPRSVILKGVATASGITFEVEKIIGAHEDCPLSEMTATPFGSDALAVEWRYGTCSSDQATLGRAAR